MPTNISNLEVGRKGDMLGVLGRMDTRTYDKGSWFSSSVEDNSGRMRIVGWNEAYLQFAHTLQEGKTYRFFGVMPRRGRDGGLEATIYKDTRIDSVEAMELTVADGNIATILSSGLRRVAVSKAIVFSALEPRVNSRGNETLRLSLIDPSDMVLDVMLVDGAVAPAKVGGQSALQVGDIVSCHGNLSDRKMLFVSDPVAKEAPDAVLSSWFAANDERLAKRRRVDDLSSLDAVATAPVGSRGDFAAVVKTCSMSPLVLADGRSKLSLSVVDQTMTQVDVSYFDVPAGTFFEVGTCVKFSGTVVPYRGRSLSTRAVTQLDAGDRAAVVLSEWWQTARCGEFGNITAPSTSSLELVSQRMPGGQLDFSSNSPDTP